MNLERTQKISDEATIIKRKKKRQSRKRSRSFLKKKEDLDGTLKPTNVKHGTMVSNSGKKNQKIGILKKSLKNKILFSKNIDTEG